mgnify:CR=1 FL=1
MALISDKTRKFFEGRRGQFRRLEAACRGVDNIVWVHSASYGEFEEVRPVVNEIRRRRPEMKILVTFFSPSGYEYLKDDPVADWVFYLPLDLPGNARRFLDIVRPVKVIVSISDYWLGYLYGLRSRGIDTYLVSARFTGDMFYFKPVGFLYNMVRIIAGTLIYIGQGKLTPERIYLFTKLAIMEYLSGGTTAAFDMYYFRYLNAQSAIDCGFRYVLCGTNGAPETVEEEYVRVNAMHPLVSLIPSIHAGYTTSLEDMEIIAELVQRHKAPFYTHISETMAQTQECIEQRGMTPTEHYESLGLFDYGGGGYHCVYLSDHDAETSRSFPARRATRSLPAASPRCRSISIWASTSPSARTAPAATTASTCSARCTSPACCRS